MAGSGSSCTTARYLRADRRPAVPANIIAYLLSAQVNFYLSNAFIWGDRWSSDGELRDLLRRWAGLHVFIAARGFMPYLLASAAGIGVSALVNFVIQDRLTFQRLHRQAISRASERRPMDAAEEPGQTRLPRSISRRQFLCLTAARPVALVSLLLANCPLTRNKGAPSEPGGEVGPAER